MKKIVAINGSPRKNGNTATLLQNILNGAKSQGAEVELVNLASLSYKGCTSCFACKRKGTEFIGKCAVKDELTPVLEKAMAADAVALGSPIYVGDVTGLMRSFIERFAFMNISYSSKGSWHKVARKNGAFVYTMNVNKLQAKLFSYVYMMNTGILKKFGGYTAQLLATNTYQFDDYSRYDALNFDEAKKRKCRETRFPKDCKKAYRIGQELATK
ncbi:MAG: flavodoxin family protein [Prevotellaceae bacterium]|jgi:multimeric flavodoxin WrbA|nr:flavodoxin family protein [Prevotellaceae bacterium]